MNKVTKDLPHILHVPTPGEHYSPATGSGPMSIIYELAREHERRGGATSVVVAIGTRHDYPGGSRGRGSLLHRSRDVERRQLTRSGGRAGLQRRATAAAYHASLETIAPGFNGVIAVHNAPAAGRFVAMRTSPRRSLWGLPSKHRPPNQLVCGSRTGPSE